MCIYIYIYIYTNLCTGIKAICNIYIYIYCMYAIRYAHMHACMHPYYNGIRLFGITWTSKMTQHIGPYTGYSLYFGILGHYFGHFGGPGSGPKPAGVHACVGK